MRYSTESRNWLCVKGYWFLSFAKIKGSNIGKTISKNLNGKYSKKLSDHAKQSATDAFKNTSKRVIEKTEKKFGDLISNKVADKFRRTASWSSPEAASQTCKINGNTKRKIDIRRK